MFMLSAPDLSYSGGHGPGPYEKGLYLFLSRQNPTTETELLFRYQISERKQGTKSESGFPVPEVDRPSSPTTDSDTVHLTGTWK